MSTPPISLCKAIPLTESPSMIDVLAPATLPAGYVFWAEVGKKSFPVTVPTGGVKRGQIFRVHAPITLLQRARRKWKSGIFGCLRFGLFRPSLWNAWCCPQLLLAQLMSRVNRQQQQAARGPLSSSSSPTLKRMTLFFVALCILDAAFAPPLFDMELDDKGQLIYSVSSSSQSVVLREAFFFCLGIPVSIYSLLVLVKLRAAVRHQHGIDTGVCGRAEDLCCVCWCHCCTMAQLAQQTADYDQEQALCCSKNGLQSCKDIEAPNETEGCLLIV